jgi:D-tyrosyl-tRNA(Tyr) deacylase
MNRSLRDVGGAALVVSQFTLFADTSSGRRPSWSGAAPPEQARRLYDHFCHALSGLGVPVATGVFGAKMAVRLVNDGPVTMLMERTPPPAPTEGDA